jgi:hypothetical protein
MSWVLWAQIMFIMFWAAILASGVISSAQTRKAHAQLAVAKMLHEAHGQEGAPWNAR